MKLKLTPELSEFIGMHIGDGTLYKTGYSLVWEMRGDLKEKDYYDFHVVPLLKKLFKINFKAKKRSGGKNGCYGVQTTNKDLTTTILSFGIKPGKKSNISIPTEIMNADFTVKTAFLRGYFDTDGCIRFDKPNKSKIAYYPKIEFCSYSKQLRDDLQELLDSVDLKSYIWNVKNRYEHKLCLAGKDKTLFWMKNIFSSNPKHQKKFIFWASNFQ
ncbi:MAG: LAGLIDADG family homing endonuclease [archaeon]